jgi:hypothetical protein
MEKNVVSLLKSQRVGLILKGRPDNARELMLRACKDIDINVLMFKTISPYPLRRDIVRFKIEKESNKLVGKNPIINLKRDAVGRYIKNLEKIG